MDHGEYHEEALNQGKCKPTFEYCALTNTSWNGEGIQYYVFATNSTAGLTPAYRFYNSALDVQYRVRCATNPMLAPPTARFGVGHSSSSAKQPAPLGSRQREDYSLTWGGPGFLPCSLDYDHDGISDLAVWHEESDAWFVLSLDGRILLWNQGNSLP